MEVTVNATAVLDSRLQTSYHYNNPPRWEVGLEQKLAAYCETYRSRAEIRQDAFLTGVK